jgi:hypothetical protein
VTKRQKHALLARRLRDKAKRYLVRESKSWKHDPEMVRMIEDDYEDFMMIAKLLRVGKCELAARHMYALDTHVYEEIPMTTYNYLEQYY